MATGQTAWFGTAVSCRRRDVTWRDAPQDTLQAAEDSDNEYAQRCNHLRHRGCTHRAPHGYYRVSPRRVTTSRLGPLYSNKAHFPAYLPLFLSLLFSVALSSLHLSLDATLVWFILIVESRRSPRTSSARNAYHYYNGPASQPFPLCLHRRALSFNLVLTSIQGRMQGTSRKDSWMQKRKWCRIS